MIGRDEQIQIPVMVDIGVGGAASHDRPVEIGAHLRRHVLEFALTQIVKQQRRLLVLNLRLDAADLLLDVPVGGEDIGIAVQVVIEKEDAERECQQAGSS